MKLAGLVSTAAFSLTMGVTALICGQNKLFAQDQRDEAKPQQQQEARPEASRPAQQEPNTARPGEAKPAEQHEDRPARSDDRSAKQETDKSTHQHESDKSSQQMKNDKQMGSGGQSDKGKHAAGNRIPEEKFHSSFGRQHTFKVHTTAAGSQPRFQYSGYTFTIVDVWPAEWAYTDDCYVDYVDGEYFLFNVAHPGIRIAVIVL